MKITDVRYHALKAKLTEPFEWPDGSAYYRTAGLVRVDTDEGIVGWGPTDSGWTKELELSVKALLVGRSPLDTWAWTQELGTRCLPLGARGACDIALWDIKGKLWGQPIHQLLGGALRDRVPAYATGGYYLLPQDSLDWLRSKVRESVARGFRAYKMKIGARNIACDLERVDAVREVLGPDRLLAVDATTTYTRPLAMQVGRELERRGILWFEDGLPADDIEGYAHLTQNLDISITAHYGATRSELPELIRRRAVDQVQPSIDGVGGYTEALRVMGMTQLHHVVYDPSCWSTHLHIAATMHLLAILPSASQRLTDMPSMLEFDTSDNPLRDDSILAEPIRLETDGTVMVPSGPGLGVEVNEEKLVRYEE
jgi:D-galactarolactone cycloisomerase